METLFQKQQSLLARTNLSFKRYMYGKFPWNSRMAGLVGPRGVGKTYRKLLQTLLDQGFLFQPFEDYLTAPAIAGMAKR